MRWDEMRCHIDGEIRSSLITILEPTNSEADEQHSSTDCISISGSFSGQDHRARASVDRSSIATDTTATSSWASPSSWAPSEPLSSLSSQRWVAPYQLLTTPNNTLFNNSLMVAFVLKVWLLAIITGAQGICMGVLDTGGNVTLIRLYRDKVESHLPYTMRCSHPSPNHHRSTDSIELDRRCPS